jgi:hypothetical protein
MKGRDEHGDCLSTEKLVEEVSAGTYLSFDFLFGA